MPKLPLPPRGGTMGGKGAAVPYNFQKKKERKKRNKIKKEEKGEKSRKNEGKKQKQKQNDLNAVYKCVKLMSF